MVLPFGAWISDTFTYLINRLMIYYQRNDTIEFQDQGQEWKKKFANSIVYF